MKSFTIYEEYFDLITILPTKEEQQELLYKIAEYMFYDKKPILNDTQIKIFKNLKRPLDISKEQSKRRTKKEPEENQIKTEKEPNKNPRETHQKMSMSMSNVNVNVLESNKGVIGGKEKTFKKPSVTEIQEYCKERNNSIDANNFYDFYESKGWKVGSQAMKDWKACIRTWERRTRKEEQLPEWFNQTIEAKTNEKNKNELEEMIKKYEN